MSLPPFNKKDSGNTNQLFPDFKCWHHSLRSCERRILTSLVFWYKWLQWENACFLCFEFQLRARPWALELPCVHLWELPSPSPCLAHLFATGWTKTLGHNTLRTSENFGTAPKLFSFRIFSPLLSSWWNSVWNGFVAPQSEKHFLSVKKTLLRVRIKASHFPDSLEEEHAAQKLSNQQITLGNWETRTRCHRPSRDLSQATGMSSDSQGLSWERYLWCWLKFPFHFISLQYSSEMTLLLGFDEETFSTKALLTEIFLTSFTSRVACF